MTRRPKFPQNPSLHVKKIGRRRSVRLGLACHASGVRIFEGVPWFWIGSQADYDSLIG